MSSKAKAGQNRNSKRLWFSNCEKQLWIYEPELKFCSFSQAWNSQKKSHMGNYIPCFQRNPYCCCSVAKLCPTLCNPMDGSMSGSSVLHCLTEFTQTHVHGVGDAIQPSHPLSFKNLQNLCGVCPFPLGFPGGSAGKESTCSAGDLGSIPVQYSGLENCMDSWVARVRHNWMTSL